jgi:DNA-binding winged helix-turn-helix (wHTH) protein
MAWARTASHKEFRRISQRAGVLVKTRFGEFTLDSDARQLLREGREIHLSPKAFDLLCLLVGARPAVLTKQDLFARIWPDTFVVDANLNVLVGELRRALGDSAQAPRLIRTVHGVGYSFCGEATDVDAKTQPGASAASRFWLEAEHRTYVLGEGDHTIGRDPRCTIRLDESSVSRRHARIRVAGTGTAVLTDLESTNGTFVGGRRVKTDRQLRDGDTVTIGSVPFRFREGAEGLPVTRRVHREKRGR